MNSFNPNNSNFFVLGDDVSENLKNQANADPTQNPIYGLLTVKKTGKLLDIIRNAMKTKNYDKVDAELRQIVSPFLYNEGEGKRVPLSSLIRYRNKERPASKRLPNIEDEETESRSSFRGIETISKACRRSVSNASSQKCQYREVCWRIDARGSVGETALHTCFLAPSVTYFELARRLVCLFPKLVNDIYLGDEYYGESPLHMAVVCEDIAMVKFLLDHGADVHKRAIGKFFTADDLKDARIDTFEHEWYDMPEETNYFGHTYWGEYPLSMAVCLELRDCYRLLLAKGANPDAQDTLGNTALHMAVIHEKMSMFTFAYELGAELHIRNRQNLTPLSLAAKLTRAELFLYILKIEREVFLQLCDIAFVGYPIDELDSIDVETGDVNQTSALSVVVFGDELGHLELFDGVLVEILKEKWNTFAKQLFFKKIRLFIIYFVVTFVSFIIRPSPMIIPDTVVGRQSIFCRQKVESENTMTIDLNCTSNCSVNDSITDFIFQNESLFDNQSEIAKETTAKVDNCYLLRFETNTDKVCRVSEMFTLIGALLYLISISRETRNLGFHVFIETLFIEPGRVMFLVSCLLVVLCVPFRIACDPRTEDRIITAVMFLTPLHFLFFCRGFKAVGPFVVMIYRMIVRDLLCFVLIYMIFVMGFAEAFFVIFLSHNGNGTNYFSGITDSILSMFLMSLNEFGDIYNEFDKTDHPFLAKALFVVYMILVSVLLIAMLIAMMGKTYHDIATRPKEWMRQWARIVLIVERGLSRSERIAFQRKYTEIKNGKRMFIMRLETNENDRNEIFRFKNLKAENHKHRLKRQPQIENE